MKLVWIALVAVLVGSLAYFVTFSLWWMAEPVWRHPEIMGRVYFVLQLLSSVAIGIVAGSQAFVFGSKL